MHQRWSLHLDPARAPFFSVIVGIALVAACNQEPPTTPVSNEQFPRGLKLALTGEVEVHIEKDGVPVTNVSGFSANLSRVGNVYTGSFNSRVVEKKTSTIVEPAAPWVDCTLAGDKCLSYNNSLSGPPPTGNGTIHNGKFTLTISHPFGAACQVTFHHNNVDTETENGNFLDATAGDQVITFDIKTSSSTCSVKSHTGKHAIPSSALGLTISAPDTVVVNQQFTATASSFGGHGTGTKLFAWDFDADTDSNKEDFGSQQLAAGTSKSHTYTTTGTKRIQAVVRDGNNTPTQGGNYALSNVETVVVVAAPPAYDSDAAGNTLPSNIAYLTTVATSVTMKNTGANSWSGTSFSLKQDNPVNFWNPFPEVAFGSGSVAPGQTKTFNFNLQTNEPEHCGSQSNFWRMSRTGTGLFGDQNGKFTFISGCPGALLGAPSFLLAWLKASPAFASAAHSSYQPQGEIVQVLRRQDFKLPKRDVDADRGFSFRYESSLAADWEVDFQYRIQFDPDALAIGTPIVGPQGRNHDYSVIEVKPGEVIVRASRRGRAGLHGTGLVLEVPFLLKAGKESPDKIALVELTTYR